MGVDPQTIDILVTLELPEQFLQQVMKEFREAVPGQQTKCLFCVQNLVVVNVFIYAVGRK
jgi:hypothetical protein